MEDNNIKKGIEEKLQKAIKREEKSIFGFFIRKYRFTYLIMMVIISYGLFSLLTIPKEAEPEIEIPFSVVTTVYPGAAPADMEELVTMELETEISGIEGLKQTNSTSGQGISSIFVEFEAEADIKESLRRLKDAVDNAAPKLPGDAETPVVNEINFSDMPIITYSLVGDYEYRELKKYADLLQDELEKVNGISEVDIIGGMSREFQVITDQTKLRQYNLTLSQIAGAIQAANFDLPAGSIEIDNYDYDVRVKGKFENIEDLDQTIVATYENSPVFLRDVARVEDTFEDSDSQSRIALKNEEAYTTISLQIRKKTGGNILNIIREANSVVSQSNGGNILPSDLQAVVTNDNSQFIKDDIKTLGQSGIQTIILITLILMMVLSTRGAIITAMTVPIAFFMAFIFLKTSGMTLNSMVLFSLVLSLGLMVDNAIVIIEGINEYITMHKKKVYEAAILSVWNFKWAIISGTMTTVAAFVGMLFVSGIMGQYIGIIPKTLIATLLSSLFVALVIIPTLSSRFIKIKDNNGATHRCERRHIFIEAKMRELHKIYRKTLNNILPSKKKRRSLIIGAWLAFIVAITLPIVGIMKLEMFPTIDFDYFMVNVELPTGSTFESTDKKTKEAEKIISEIPELKNYVANIGTDGSNKASITVNLESEEMRERTSYEISKEIRPQLEKIQGAIVNTEELQAGPPSGSPIEVRVFGAETEEIIKIANEVTRYFQDIKGVINLDNSIENSAGEFTFSIDRKKADYYGLTTASIASTLRSAIYGSKASTVNIGDDDIDIVVKYDKSKFKNTDDLENVLLSTKQGDVVPLKQIAELNFEPALLEIKHRDGKELITVTADLEPGTDLRKIMSDFNAYQADLNVPDGYSLDIGGETEDIEKSYREMFLSLIIGMILIYTILVLMFNSFAQPFIILFSLPLAIPGVIIGLTLLGQPFSITAFIGIVALAGIVVNDSIILIDRINKNIQDGYETIEAIVEGGVTRMQPIFITSITTIAGIFPLYFADALWRGLSLTVISGLIFSTMLILIIIPTMYYGITPKAKLKS